MFIVAHSSSSCFVAASSIETWTASMDSCRAAIA